MGIEKGRKNSNQDRADLFDNIAYQFKTVTNLVSDTTLSYDEVSGKKPVKENDLIHVADGDYTYRVAKQSKSSTEVHLSTAGDIRLIALPDAAGGVDLTQLGWACGDIWAPLTKALGVVVTDVEQPPLLVLPPFKLIYLKGDMDLSYPVFSPTSVTNLNLEIHSAPGSKITYTGGANTGAMLTLNYITSLRISGDLTLECKSEDETASIGLAVVAVDGASLVDISGVTVLNPRASVGFTEAAGIKVACVNNGAGNILRITDCTVKNVNRDDSLTNAVSTGIGATDFRTMTVVRNQVNEVLVKPDADGNKADADGIKVFSTVTVDDIKKLYFKTAVVTIEDNQVSNCAGRFIKTQTRGSTSIRNNTLRLDKAIDLIQSWRGIDCQVDGAFITDNLFELTTIKFVSDTVDPPDYMPITLRVPLPIDYEFPPDYDGQPINGRVCNNRILVPTKFDKNGTAEAGNAAYYFSRIFFLDLRGLENYAYTTTFEVIGNYAVTTAGWESVPTGANATYCSYFAGTVRCPLVKKDVDDKGNTFYTEPATWATGATARIVIRDNRMASARFLEQLTPANGTTSHNGDGDLTGKLFLTITGNMCPSPSLDPIMQYTNKGSFTSSIHIADNAVGSLNNYWRAPFDFAKILGGEFYFGNIPDPACENGPYYYAYSLISRNGQFLMVDMFSGNKRKRTISVSPVGEQPVWI